MDAPYTWCWECSGVCRCSMEVDGVDCDVDEDGHG